MRKSAQPVKVSCTELETSGTNSTTWAIWWDALALEMAVVNGPALHTPSLEVCVLIYAPRAWSNSHGSQRDPFHWLHRELEQAPKTIVLQQVSLVEARRYICTKIQMLFTVRNSTNSILTDPRLAGSMHILAFSCLHLRFSTIAATLVAELGLFSCADKAPG